jgi:hypothetical protein
MSGRLERSVAAELQKRSITDPAIVDYITAIITMDEEEDADKSQMIRDFLIDATGVC